MRSNSGMWVHHDMLTTSSSEEDEREYGWRVCKMTKGLWMQRGLRSMHPPRSSWPQTFPFRRRSLRFPPQKMMFSSTAPNCGLNCSVAIRIVSIFLSQKVATRRLVQIAFQGPPETSQGCLDWSGTFFFITEPLAVKHLTTRVSQEAIRHASQVWARLLFHGKGRTGDNESGRLLRPRGWLGAVVPVQPSVAVVA